MSGHSKWSTIKHKKAVVDAKRSGVFTKMANAITVSVRKGGGVGNPDMNFALRLAIDKARAVNMPKENIERAIEKGMGGGGGQTLDELVMEGYGPEGVALIVEVVTDNRNRTVAEIKNILEKGGGRLGEPGSVMYQFDIVGEITGTLDLTDDMELALIDLGMTDFETDEKAVRLYSSVHSLKQINDYLIQKGAEDLESAIVYKPKVTVKPAHTDGIAKLVEALRDNDDVQEVYINAV